MSNNEIIDFMFTGAFGFIRIFIYFNLSTRIIYKYKKKLLIIELFLLLLSFKAAFDLRDAISSLNFLFSILIIITFMFRRRHSIIRKKIEDDFIKFQFLFDYNQKVLNAIMELKKDEVLKNNNIKPFEICTSNIKTNKDDIDTYVNNIIKKLGINLNEEEESKIKLVKQKAFKEYIASLNKLKN